MLKISHFGKMGDMVYAMPTFRALARLHGPIHLTTSPLCWQMVPLLWEQPYIADVEIDDQHEYKMTNGLFNFWEYYKPGEGLNLSSQPSFFENKAPLSWTLCYARAAGVKLREEDCCIFPALQNRRRFLRAMDVSFDGKKQELPNYVVVAPEVETLESGDVDWEFIEDVFSTAGGIDVIFVGMNWYDIPTTVPTLANIIADAKGFIGAHSFPWHLARHLEVPAICLQDWREGLLRCIPTDTEYHWYETGEINDALADLLSMMSGDKVPNKFPNDQDFFKLEKLN